MSKLAKAIDYTFTGDVRGARELGLRYTDVKVSYDTPTYNPLRGLERQVRLGVKVSFDAWMSSEDLIHTNEHAPAVQQEVLRDLKRAMVEEVFGEFRPFIIEMRASLYDGDRARTRKLLAELEEKMFADGL